MGLEDGEAGDGGQGAKDEAFSICLSGTAVSQVGDGTPSCVLAAGVLSPHLVCGPWSDWIPVSAVPLSSSVTLAGYLISLSLNLPTWKMGAGIPT